MKIYTRIWRKLLQEWWQIIVPLQLRAQGVELGKDVRFYGMPIVDMAKGSRIRIGDRVVLCSDSRFTALGVNHPVLLRTLRTRAEIVIGNDCGISGGSICAALRVELGNECLLGANVTMADTNFHALNPNGRRFNSSTLDISAEPIIIEDNVFIGTGTILLKGLRVGRNSVIGASSVVTKDVPPDVIVAGSPVRILRGL